jgi:ubiquinone/menaquinone biosynthesis C-methylase UbiE
MMDIIWATPLYEFLRRCNAIPVDKVVLDCGAGGSQPPLALFYQYGYKTYGIDISEEPLAQAQAFCTENNMPLNIFRGDMRWIPFPSQQFGCVYSYNAIDFMTKPDIARSVREMARVLKPGGLCYINLLSVDDPDSWEPYCKTAPDLDLLKSEGFAHHEDDEAEAYFEAFEIVRKEKRIVEKTSKGKKHKQIDIEYIARKR